MTRLFVISNRVGPLSDGGKAGGLAVGLADALRERGGVWFGWTGEASEEGTHGPLHTQTEGKVELATVDMTQSDLDAFYHGFANQSLWPVFHYRTDLANYDRRNAETYERINERFGARVGPLLRPGDLVWVHDYHFIPLGEKIRAGGFTGAIGFFLHVPFPPPEVITTLPHAHRLVRSMLSYDVVGFQTQIDRDNFARFLVSEFNGREIGDGWVEAAGREVHAGVFPIGIDAGRFAEFAVSPEAKRRFTQLRSVLRDRKQIIGVDRLDYSKGIPDRLRGFERLLQDYPENRDKASLLQVAPVSRGDVQAYADLRSELEELAGHINGVYGLLDWTPVRIMTRGFARKGLAGLYRASDVALITPLRDGMNLVAKEYIAAQDPENPGVLVLSRFAGAAEEMREALIVNPYDVAEVAEVLQRALQMPLEERKRRWTALHETICKGDARHWCNTFLDALESAIIRRREKESAPRGDSGSELAEAPPRAKRVSARSAKTESPSPRLSAS